jgi:hypothetical protein
MVFFLLWRRCQRFLGERRIKVSAMKKNDYSGPAKQVTHLGRTPDILDTNKSILIIVYVNGEEVCRSSERELPTAIVDRKDVAVALEEYAKQVRTGPAFDA